MEHKNKTIKFSGAEIYAIIPQRPPFVFIDTFYEPEQKSFFSSYLIVKENPLVKNKILQEGGLFENAAQTAAAGNGYNALLKNINAPIGYIGAIKRSELFALPSVNDTLHTTVNTISELMNALVVEASVYCKGNMLITFQMNIFLKNE